MDVAKATLIRVIGEKAAIDFIKSVLALENVQEIKKRVCALLDTRKHENRQVYEILMKEKTRIDSISLEHCYIKGNTDPNSRCDVADIQSTGSADMQSTPACESHANKTTMKKKTKFQPLFSEGAHADQLVSILPGRHPCQCLATKHQLIGNCSSCGRIVCAQEGSGRCFHCGQLVCTAAERDKIAIGTKQAQKLYNRLYQLQWAPGTETPPYRSNKDKEHLDNTDKVTTSSTTTSLQIRSDHNGTGEGASSESEDLDCLVIPAHCGGASERLEAGLAAALANRDRLLEYDVTSAKRTKVLDDELDYFASAASDASSAVWLSPQVRERVIRRATELRAHRHASRLETSRLCLDLAERGAIFKDTGDEAARQLYRPTEQELEQLEHGDRRDGQAQASSVDQSSNQAPTASIADPSLHFALPKFVPQETAKEPSSDSSRAQLLLRALRQPDGCHRLQETTSRQLADDGYCLSMHQPWASLLVRGIKRDEGRVWYSAHRGCLWIAATSKAPDPVDIDQLENSFLKTGGLKDDLPIAYPTGCLLGRVNVIDVLAQEEYHQKYPNGDSDSPYVFVCDDPRELLFKLPVTGKHKLYRLEKHVHSAALRNLT